MRTIIYLLMFLGVIICNTVSYGQKVPIIKYNELESIINKNDDTVRVINFWATWCKPCIEELPFFEQLNKETKGKKVKVYLVSLDFTNKYESSLLPFIKRKQLQSGILLLDEPNYNSWIDKIDPKWSGSIPATLIVKSTDKIHNFYEKSFTYEELNTIISPLINP